MEAQQEQSKQKHLADLQSKHNLQKPMTGRGRWERDDTAVVVEIDTIPMMQVLPCEVGLIAMQGVKRYLVPKSVVPLLLEQCRSDQDRADMKAATERFERDRLRHIDSDAAVQKFRETGDKDEETKRVKQLLAQYPGSPEATFQAEFQRPLAPFDRVTVIESDIVNPTDAARVDDENLLLSRERQMRAEELAAMSAAVAKAVSSAVQPVAGAGNSDSIATAVSAAMAPLLKELAQTIAQGQGASKKGGG